MTGTYMGIKNSDMKKARKMSLFVQFNPGGEEWGKTQKINTKTKYTILCVRRC